MRIIIVGCGRMGADLSQDLSLHGHRITVVDSNPAAFERLSSSFKGRTVTGIGFDRDVLLQAGIEQTDGLAAVTSSDEANVVVARLAHQVFRVPRVVARLYDPRKAEIYQRLGLQTIAPVSWGVQQIVELFSYSPFTVTMSLGNGEIDVVEIEIPSLLVGRTVRELAIPGEVQVIAMRRGSKTLLPTWGTVFQEGDRVHLAILATSTRRIQEMLGLA